MGVQLRFMGGFELCDKSGAQLRLPTRKSAALLAFLTQADGAYVAREKLASLLWPRSDETQARASLRQELAVLRKALTDTGLPEIDANKEKLRLLLQDGQADTVRLSALAKGDSAPEMREIAQLYRGEFLADLNIRSSAFDEWLWIERQRLRDLSIDALAQLLELDRRSGHPHEVIGTAQALLRADATNEAAYLALMEALRACGRRTDALQHYQRFRDVLRRELDAEPSQAIADLAEDIRISTQSTASNKVPRREGVAASISRRLARFPAPAVRDRRKATLAVLGLAGVGELGSNFDASELAVAQDLFQQRAARLVDEYGGSYVPCAGGRVLACFGYPTADEHDSERAVLASLGVVSEPISLATGETLWPRAAIARGDILINPPGPDWTGVGFTGVAVHVATRLEQMAAGCEVLVSSESHELVHRAFETATRANDGAEQPVAYLIRRERVRSNRFDARRLSTRLSPLIGRDEAIAELHQGWVAARRGQGQAIRILGESGLGKSRLAHAFLQSVLSENPAVIQLNASPLHRQSALYAIVQFIEEDTGLDRVSDPAERHARLSLWAADLGLSVETVVPTLFTVLSAPFDKGVSDHGRGQLQKSRIFGAIVDAVKARASVRPLVLLIEDLHWLDPMSGEFLRYLLPRIETTPVLVLMTVRPVASNEWVDRLPGRSVTLRRLTTSEARKLLSELLPAGTSPERFDTLVERSDGIPLYLEELSKSATEWDAENETDNGESASWIPDSLEASLRARIDRLDSARDVLQVASVFGKVFDQKDLQAAIGMSPEILEIRLSKLQEADLVYRVERAPNARYEFKNVLVQELTYRSLTPENRAASHLLIADALVRHVGTIGPKSPEIVARHYAMAGQPRKAIGYFESAGRKAARVSAHQEAATHFRAALALLPELDAGETRSRLEMDLLLQLGPQVLAIQGFAASDVAEIYERARELVFSGAAQAEPEKRDRILWGLWGYFLVRGDISASYGFGAELLSNARAREDPVSIVAGNQMLGLCSFYRGRLADALAYLQEARTLYTEDQADAHQHRYGMNLAVAAWSYLSWTCALRGEARRATEECQRNLKEAERLGHDFSQVVAGVFATGTFLFLGDETQALSHAQRSADLPELRRFSQMRAQAIIQKGRLADRNENSKGIAVLRAGLETYQDTGAALAVPHGKAWIAQAQMRSGEWKDALQTLDNALEHSSRCGVRYFDAELHRLRGNCLVQLYPGANAEAEDAYAAALQAGHETGADLLYLRAANDYADALIGWGRRLDARSMLHDVQTHCRFADSDLPELQRLKALEETTSG